MRVAHVLWCLKIGGIETMLVNIVNEQVKLAEEVRLYIINDMIEPSLKAAIDQKVKVFCLGRKEGSCNPFPLFRLNLYLLSYKPDVIHIHAASVVDLIIKSLHEKCLLTRHTTSSQGVMKNSTIKKYRKVFAISNSVRDNLKENYGLDAEVVLNGVNLGLIDKREYHVPKKGETFRIVSTGRLLAKVKGQDVLIKAVSLLNDLDIHLDIIGDGPDKDYLNSLINDLNQQDRISLIGWKPQNYIFDHLKDYDLFVMGSNYEGFGLTIAEAMAAMLPVLVTDIEGPKEVVDNGKYGHLFKVGDSEVCAEKIRMLYNEYDKCDSLERAHEYVLANFSIVRVAKEYVESYK